jgi:hypothetical protein
MRDYMGNRQVRELRTENNLLHNQLHKLTDLFSDECIADYISNQSGRVSVHQYVDWIRRNYNLL